jgi:threonine aldolase
MPDFVDFFSDTKTRPTAAMRAAMANADVGDERADEDPSVNRLVARCAELLGKPAALYLPSGTMCNEIALAVHCRPGDEVICDRTSHLIGFEGGGPAALAGVMLTPLSGDRGRFDAAQLATALRPDRPLAQLTQVAAAAHAHGLAAHMDGARLLNAVVATGIAAADYARDYDSVWIDFSKGLGAPGGAVLAGGAEFIREANRLKLRWGGAMRQSGIIAAACDYALDHHVARLADDHANAAALAQGIAQIDGLAIDAAGVETNLVYFDVTRPGLNAAQLCAQLLQRGVRMGEMGAHTVRAVTHLDVDAAAVQKALAALRDALA